MGDKLREIVCRVVGHVWVYELDTRLPYISADKTQVRRDCRRCDAAQYARITWATGEAKVYTGEDD